MKLRSAHLGRRREAHSHKLSPVASTSSHPHGPLTSYRPTSSNQLCGRFDKELQLLVLGAIVAYFHVLICTPGSSETNFRDGAKRSGFIIQVRFLPPTQISRLWLAN